MRETSERSSGDLFADHNSAFSMNNAATLARMWTELAKQDLETEAKLNNLKTSNVLKLGLLKRKQFALLILNL